LKLLHTNQIKGLGKGHRKRLLNTKQLGSNGSQKQIHIIPKGLGKSYVSCSF